MALTKREAHSVILISLFLSIIIWCSPCFSFHFFDYSKQFKTKYFQIAHSDCCIFIGVYAVNDFN